MTSNGMAAHLDFEHAAHNARLELLERDTVLTAWLLRSGPQKIPDYVVLSDSRRRLLKLNEMPGITVRMGYFNAGSPVGLLGVTVDGQSVIASAAASNLSEVVDQLIRRAAIAVSGLRSATPPEPLPILPQTAGPLDHLRFYLDKSPLGWLDWPVRIPVFSAIPIQTLDVTADNPWARETGFRVARALSSDAQDLWFGPTTASTINLNRVSHLRKDFACEALHLEPHPFS